MFQLFTTFLFQPLLNALVFLYNIIPGHDIGLAIIGLTIVIKIILYPFSLQSLKSQKALQDLQPKIEEIKKNHKDDKEKQARAMMELYKKEKVNPLSSCLPLLIQLPFLIAVYQVFQTGLSSASLNLLYPFISNPGHLNPVSFGLIDLSKPNVVLAVLTGLAQYFQSKMLVTKRPPKKIPGAKDEDMMTIMNQQMLYFMPVFTVIICISLPSGLVVYWLVMTILTILQQLWMFKDKNKTNQVVEVK
jgi:YidC/Oxa1 family membrane protein insertase